MSSYAFNNYEAEKEPLPVAPAPSSGQEKTGESDSVESLKKGHDHERHVAVGTDRERAQLAEDEAEVKDDQRRWDAFYAKSRSFILAALAALILGWWISSTVLKVTRHRW